MGNLANILVMLIIGCVCFWGIFVGMFAVFYLLFGAGDSSMTLGFISAIIIVIVLAMKK